MTETAQKFPDRKSHSERLLALQSKIAQRIAEKGAVTIAEFMDFVMGDKECGYYANAEPFGRDGDFITAPEISQLFGEMLAMWVIITWQDLGCPKTFILAEGGPGRGTLSDDILRSLAKIAPQCLQAAHIALMETSPALRRRQKQILAKHNKPVIWVEDCAALESHRQESAPSAPLIFIANELLDVLPVRQYQKSAQGWHERLITMQNTNDGNNGKKANCSLCFTLGQAQILPAAIQNEAYKRQCAAAEIGSIIEISAARAAFIRDLSRLITHSGGAALLIDYGSLQHGFGDTLQAVAKHRFAPVLTDIGASDLSSHVDFAALSAEAQAQGCRTAALTQGEFLLKMGLEMRAARLAAGKSAANRRQIYADAARLTAPEHMGKLFKILCIADIKTQMPPFSW